MLSCSTGFDYQCCFYARAIRKVKLQTEYWKKAKDFGGPRTLIIDVHGMSPSLVYVSTSPWNRTKYLNGFEDVFFAEDRGYDEKPTEVCWAETNSCGAIYFTAQGDQDTKSTGGSSEGNEETETTR